MAASLPAPHTEDIAQRVRWYVFVRLLFLLAIGVPGITSIYATESWSEQAQRDSWLLFAGLGSNLLFYVLARLRQTTTYQQRLAITWLGLDVALISLLIFSNGGIESRSPILYAIPILIAAALFGRKATYITAISCAVLYSGLIIADYLGIITSVGAFDPSLRTNLAYVIHTISFFPAIIIVIALAVDFITKLLHQQQRQAREALEALERAQETAKLGSWEWDVTTDTISWSNELYKIYGLVPGKTRLDFTTYLRLIHPDDLPAHRQAIARALRKKASFSVDHRALLPDGSIKHIHGEGRPLLDAAGEVVKLTGIGQDVTEMYTLDAAKREFVSLASHQLRTPASGVKAFLSLLIDGYAGELTKKQLSFIKKAHESNNRQLEIIDNLLSLASIESGKISIAKTPVALHEIIQRSLPHHQPRIKEKRLKLIIKNPKRPLVVNVDQSHMLMAIDNLISNAIKYTPDRGTITVSLHATRSSAYISITDTGVGIQPDDIPELFKKFSRLNHPISKTVGGSGLGLYLAKYIVELHGGVITVKSQPDMGTEFRIRLPLAAPKRYNKKNR